MLGLPFCAQAFSLVVSEAKFSLLCTGFSSWSLPYCRTWNLEHRLSRCGAWDQLLCGMLDLPGPGIKAMSLALAGDFSSTEPPRKSYTHVLSCFVLNCNHYSTSAFSWIKNICTSVCLGSIMSDCLAHMRGTLRLLSIGFSGKNTGQFQHHLGIFPTKGLNLCLLCLLPWQSDPYH